MKTQRTLQMKTNEYNIKKTINKISLLLVASSLIACDKGSTSFSLLSESQTFKQSSVLVPRKIDILWVVDNSGSMSSSQQNLADNFSSFINNFSQKGYDFHMGVTTSDAYLDYHYNTQTRSTLKDGAGSTHTGVFVMDSLTPNLNTVFTTNIKQGIAGSGDERAFSSMEAALKNPNNSALVRPGSFLAVIIVSDEEDYSHNDYQNGTSSYYYTSNVNDPNMLPISYFTNYLDTLTNSTATIKNYSVNTISILDNACLTALGAGRRIGNRYMEIADQTGGIKLSLCDDFAAGLDVLSSDILELASSFQLDREPYESSINVVVNGSVVPNDPNNGWTYDAGTNSVQFHGSAVPAADANVIINFDPKNVKI